MRRGTVNSYESIKMIKYATVLIDSQLVITAKHKELPEINNIHSAPT